MACRISLLVAIVLVAGCSKTKTEETIVRGQIFYRGQPIADGLIVFAPDTERGSDGPLMTAKLLDDGSFKLATPDGKPIPAGWYRLSVAPRAGSVDLPTADRPYPGLPAKYRNPSQSGLVFEVKTGTDNVICFDLEDA
ncbi:MAG TPA: hypothetical protein VHR66_23120 [Gemmataceae bacterium]|nr:hypothetical protein [Gemmataceae bacterium]